MSKAKKAPLPNELTQYLGNLSSEERRVAEVHFSMAIAATKELSISQLWDNPDLSISHWILLMTGTNQDEEMKIANVLLNWKAFSVKDSTRIICIPTSERTHFRYCSFYFKEANCPTLFVSDNSEMNDYIKIDSKLLLALSEKGELQRFLNKVHTSIENSGSLDEIRSTFRMGSILAGVKLVYSEIKGLVSLSAGVEA